MCIYRDKRFSPNSEEKDRAILDAVAENLQAQGHEVECVEEAHWVPSQGACRLVLSMGRLAETLRHLASLDMQVINSPEGVGGCARSRLQRTMEDIGIPTAPKDGDNGYWIKRGDASAQGREDVVFVPRREELEPAIRAFEQRGISDYTVSAHVCGDLVKFYGVRGSGFFRHYYPTDDRDTKFGDERHNGMAHHYPFDVKQLELQAERLAEAVNVSIYGGDCIVREDGSWCIIDFNDWPSFSRCREEAATAIVRLVNNAFAE